MKNDDQDDPVLGVMLDLARALENRQYYRNCIDFLAQRGVTHLLWHFTDDQGCAVILPSVPEAASPHAYTADEMRALCAYAKERGVQIIPELASLGHTVYLTRLARFRHLAESEEMFSSMCPVAPETRTNLRALIGDVASIFDSTDIHLGLDETNFGAHPLSKAALNTRSRTDIFADHINFLHGVVTGVGKRMWMWADGLLHDPALAAKLPRDIVMCNWRYRPHEPAETTQYLLDQGFDVVLCSASISSQQMLFPGERFALPNIRSLREHSTLTSDGGGRVLGHINTVWTPVRYLADSLWLGLDLSVTLIRDGADSNVAEAIAKFGQSFYGLGDSRAFVAACEVVLELSPCRDEWTSVLTLAQESIADPEKMRVITVAAPRWADAAALLEDSVRPAVHEHHREFATFVLMVELAAHCYATAAGLEHFTAAEALRAAVEREHLLARVDAVWDQERFADGPRKYAAPIHHFDADHLIPMLRRGADRLREVAAARPEERMLPCSE
ncbi:MAG: glycoside hydrolase family 20 [Phycisphaerales bacterium]|nr:glycoside hydrolase family 20 [Phycisphaerales bacterium]